MHKNRFEANTLSRYFGKYSKYACKGTQVVEVTMSSEINYLRIQTNEISIIA